MDLTLRCKRDLLFAFVTRIEIVLTGMVVESSPLWQPAIAKYNIHGVHAGTTGFAGTGMLHTQQKRLFPYSVPCHVNSLQCLYTICKIISYVVGITSCDTLVLWTVSPLSPNFYSKVWYILPQHIKVSSSVLNILCHTYWAWKSRLCLISLYAHALL